jgi:hypothetical protein
MIVGAVVFAADPITIDIGKRSEVKITVPSIKRSELIDLMATFLSKGQNTAEFRRVLQQSPELTLILTTK